MSLGRRYFGVCTSNEHLQWLTNASDRASIQYIVSQGSPLYFNQDLAIRCEEQFADILEHLKAQDEASGAASGGEDSDGEDAEG